MSVNARSMMPESVTDANTLLRVYTFGLLTIEWREAATGQVLALPSQRLYGRGVAPALALLKFLLCQPHRYASRSRIMEQFWPDSPHRRAEERLDDVASGLRTLLRPPGSQEKLLYYVYGGKNGDSGYRLEAYPRIWVDADAFCWYVEQAIRLERFGQESLSFWEQAYQLASRGTFLLEESYSDWAGQRRLTLEGHLRQCIHRLVQLLREIGAYEQAMLRARTYWQQHMTDENALCLLLELLGDLERFQEAEQYYCQAQEALKREGGEPDVRTQDIMKNVRLKPIQREQRGEIHSGKTNKYFTSTMPVHPHYRPSTLPFEQDIIDGEKTFGYPSDQDMDKLRRHLLRLGVSSTTFLAAASNEMARPDLEIVERLIRVLSRPSSIDRVFMEQLEAATRNNRKRFVLAKKSIQDMHFLQRNISDHLSTLTQLLGYSHPTQISELLYTLAGETAQLLGDIYFHLGRSDTAHIYYDLAIQIVTEIHNDVLHAVILGRKSFIPIYSGDAKAAIPLLHQAHTLVTHNASDLVRAWLLVIEAEAQAAISDTQACNEALSQCECLLLRSAPGPSTCSFPSEEAYAPLNTQRLLGYMGACYLRLSEPQKAQAVLQTYLASTQYTSPHKQSITLIDLAKAHALQGELEAMYLFASQALDLFEQTKSVRALQRLLNLRQEVERWKESIYIKRFDQQLGAISSTRSFER